MKGLLLKDWYLSLKYYKPYFLILIGFAVMSIWAGYNPFLLSYPFMLISMMAPGLQNMDEGCKWDMYCGTMPLSKMQMVSEKYLFGLIWSALGLLIVMVSQIIRMAIAGGSAWAELWNVLSVCLTLVFLLPSVSLPLVFKFGAEKGRISQYIIIGCVCGGATLLSLQESGAVPQVVSTVGMSGIVVLAALTLYVASWFLSIRFYEKREIR